MSNKIVNAIREIVLPPMQKFVLYCLADEANDAGVCWPSVAAIMTKTCMGERTVRRAIRDLEEQGHVVANREAGRATSYYLRAATPANAAGVPHRQGCRSGRTPLPVRHHTPAGAAGPYIDPLLIHERPTPAREGFLKFQSEYPKHRSMERAWKTWQRLNPDEQLQAAIMAGLMQAKTSVEWLRRDEKGRQGRYIPFAWRFLEERRWEDDYGPVKLSPPSPTVVVVEPQAPLTDEARERGSAAAREAKARLKASTHG